MQNTINKLHFIFPIPFLNNATLFHADVLPFQRLLLLRILDQLLPRHK